MLPSTFVVEETQHDELGQLRIGVEGAGRGHARKLNTNPEKKPRLNFGEHKKGVLTSFDRNHKVLSPDEPVLHGTSDEFKEAVKATKDPNLIKTTSQLECEKKKDAKETPVVMGVKQVYHLVQHDPHGGLSFFYNQTSDKSMTHQHTRLTTGLPTCTGCATRVQSCPRPGAGMEICQGAEPASPGPCRHTLDPVHCRWPAKNGLTAIAEVKEEVKTDPEMQARLEKTNCEKTNEEARRRSVENQLSDEFVFDSDADDEEDPDIDDVAQEYEVALTALK
ncbi:hypothetical protein FSPOR_3110 [Fusarium sporotrichioides]|uniref:Uncharacterized protein n=1 Tax=Fusarium sporotrichioides TaxID=5514 RepID=A0A395SGZ9_FUSSP|nr:hypothetical protein FSPOR_3110 [Fusarium sporotrichioides]